MRVEQVSVDDGKCYIALAFNKKYHTIIEIDEDRMEEIPDEGDEVEARWDDKISEVEYYYNGHKLME